MLMAGILISCTNDMDKVAAIEMPATAPDRITYNAEYLFTDSGMLQNILRAGRIDEYRLEPARHELNDGVELIFFDSVGDPGSVLTARRGIILPEEERMDVFEQVVFVNMRGERLETEQLTWHQDSGRVRTEKAVRIQRGGDIIHGEGLDADQDLGQYTIHRITGEIFLSEDDTLAP